MHRRRITRRLAVFVLTLALAGAFVGVALASTSALSPSPLVANKKQVCLAHPHPAHEQRRLAAAAFALSNWASPKVGHGRFEQMQRLRQCAKPSALPAMRKSWREAKGHLLQYAMLRHSVPRFYADFSERVNRRIGASMRVMGAWSLAENCAAWNNPLCIGPPTVTGTSYSSPSDAAQGAVDEMHQYFPSLLGMGKHSEMQQIAMILSSGWGTQCCNIYSTYDSIH